MPSCCAASEPDVRKLAGKVMVRVPVRNLTGEARCHSSSILTAGSKALAVAAPSSWK